MRGMNSDQIGLSMDGIPINDSGNYAVYPNLLGDAENLEEVFVTQGSSEADGPHIGSSGGNIGLATRRPAKDFRRFRQADAGQQQPEQNLRPPGHRRVQRLQQLAPIRTPKRRSGAAKGDCTPTSSR